MRRDLLPLLFVLLLMCCTARQTEGAPSVPINPVPVEEGYFPGADSLQLFYRLVGSGEETVVYLHGGPINMNDGGYELDSLARGRRLLVFDQRCGGQSALVNDPERLTVEYYLRDIEALYQHFDLRRMILMGQSWGSGLAILYASRHPEQIARLLLLSPMPPARTPFWSERLSATGAEIGKDGLARLAEIAETWNDAPDSMIVPLFREEIRLSFRGYVSDIAALDRMIGDYAAGTPASIRHQSMAGAVAFQSLGDWDFRPFMASLQVPVLVMEGAKTKVPMKATREWARVLPNSRLFLVPGGSHLVWLEGTEAFFPAAQTFLGGNWPEGAVVVK